MLPEEKLELDNAVLRDELKRAYRSAKILKRAVGIAAEIFAENPPGDLDAYTPEMFKVLMGNKGNSERWKHFLINTAIKEYIENETVD